MSIIYYIPKTTGNAQDDYTGAVYPDGTEKREGWLTEDELHTKFPPSEPPQPTLEEARSTKIIEIDAETSAAICAGFDYSIDGQMLHFSYDTIDQQNFADTANASTLAKLGVPGIPNSITWNGWQATQDASGAEQRSLVRLTLTPDSFLTLYMDGALRHKAIQMENGGQRKAAVAGATTVAEIESI